MPITASYAFKQAMKAPIKQLRTTIVLESGDDVVTYTGNDNLTNLTINTSGNYFKAATGALEFTLLGVDYDLIGYKATVTLAVLTDAANDTWESADIGYYRVTEQKVNLETGLTSFKGVDALGYLATQPYVAGTITYPITVANLATAVVANTSVGLVTDVSTLPNGTYTIGEDLYKNISNVTYRDILGEIAGATATVCGALTGTGDVAFIPPQLTASEAISYDNLKTIKLKDRYGRVNTVVLSRQPQEDNVVVRDDTIANLPAGKNLVRYSDTFRTGNAAAGITPTIDEDGTLKVVATSKNGNWHTGWWDASNVMANVESEFKEGDEFTISFTIKKESGATGKPNIYIKNGMGYWAMVGVISEEYSEIYYTGKWKKANSINIHLGWSACVGTFHIKNFMIKKGGYAPYEPFKPNGNIEVKLANNEILDDNRETLATPILNAVKGLYYSPFEATTEGHGWHTVGDRLAVYQTSPNLPLEYQELTYIASTQTQWIDTGVLPQDIDTMEADVTLDELRQQQERQFFLGGNYDTVKTSGVVSYDYLVVEARSNNQLQLWYETYRNVAATWTLGERKQIKTVLKKGLQQMYVNGAIVLNNSTAHEPPVSSRTLPLMAYNYKDNTLASYGWGGKIYSLKLSKGGVLVRDFIPCYRKSDNVAGLFDKVNGVFYTNAGTGEFTKGAEVAQPQPIAEVVITDVKLNLTGGISETIKGEALTESQTNYSLAGGIAKTIYNTEIKVDKQNQEISSVVSQLNQLSDSTAENFTQVNQTINNITTTIQETGGGNIILNSVGYDTEPDGSGLVGWTNTGTVSSVTSPESISYGAVSGNEIDLGASSSITQRVAVDGNNTQKYSLSFKAKKSTVGKVTVTLSNSIDNYVITLPAGTAYNWQSFSLTDFTASENYFNVTIAANSAVTLFGITDLMLNVGNTTMQWVQASSEILNTQVAVTKNGVKVRSSVYDGDYVEITPLGFNGYSDASGSTQTVFTLNRDTTKVQKLRAETQMEMPPLKIVPITSGSNTGWAFVKMEDN